MTFVSTIERYRGCLLGGAVGDALGAAVEFLSLAEIRERFGPDGITEPASAYGRVGTITDDTQMTLFTAEGLLQADDRLQRGVGHPANQLWAAYLRWLRTQGEDTPVDGDEEFSWVWHGELDRCAELRSRRAPGSTCLSALLVRHRDGSWRDPAANDSKGCGGVMRAAPCGLIGERWGPDSPFELGVIAAAITHGHPSGYLAAGALAVIIDRLIHGEELLSAGRIALERVRREEHCREVGSALESALALASSPEGPSPERLAHLGQGWVAEEALSIALYCVMATGDFAAAVRLAANHSGDSDSTAAIAGNIAGALYGIDAIPRAWLDVLELRGEIDRLALALRRRFVQGKLGVGWELWEWPGMDDLAADENEPDEDDATIQARAAEVRALAERDPREAFARASGMQYMGRWPIDPSKVASAVHDGEETQPPHDAYWVEPGRVLAGPYPGDRDRDRARRKLQEFLDFGVTCFIDLTEEEELKPYARLLRRIALSRGMNATHIRIPVTDLDVPTRWRMEIVQSAIKAAIDAGEVVYLHCWGGVGRTGTAAACRLVEAAAEAGNALSGEEAMERLAKLRVNTTRANRVSPETAAQAEFVRAWAPRTSGRTASTGVCGQPRHGARPSARRP